jgi:hypothetical protein
MGGVAYYRRLAKDQPGSRFSTDIVYVWPRISPETLPGPCAARWLRRGAI